MSKKRLRRGCRPQRYTVQQVADALRLSAGILSAAGERLGCTGQCVADYLNRYPKLRDIAREAQEATLDLAETGLVALIRQRHPGSIQFYLRTKGRTRGYSTRTEFAATDQKRILSESDFSHLTDQELDALEASLEILKQAEQRHAAAVNGSGGGRADNRAHLAAESDK